MTINRQLIFHDDDSPTVSYRKALRLFFLDNKVEWWSFTPLREQKLLCSLNARGSVLILPCQSQRLQPTVGACELIHRRRQGALWRSGSERSAWQVSRVSEEAGKWDWTIWHSSSVDSVAPDTKCSVLSEKWSITHHVTFFPDKQTYIEWLFFFLIGKVMLGILKYVVQDYWPETAENQKNKHLRKCTVLYRYRSITRW